MKSRREFLKVTLGGLSLVSLGASIPNFVSQLAFGDPVLGTDVSNDNILVVIQLSGGNDGLNTVIPFKDDVYYKSRPQIGLRNNLHKVNDSLALNPGMKPFKEMFDAGELAIINGCGYPQPNRSHFESMAIWHSGNPKDLAHGGWLGHYIDHCCRGTDNVMQAINLGQELPMALVTSGPPVPSISSIEDFSVKTDKGSAFDAKMEQQIIRELNEVKQNTPALQFLSRQATNAMIASDQIRKLTAGYKPDVIYPSGLGNQLKLIAQIIAGNFGTKVLYCQTGGYDTHANQLNSHEGLLNNVASSIQAFTNDLKAKKLDKKVTIMCFSEFGRRVKQNDSGGTDHGAAGPMFVVGTGIKPGIYGDYPSLTDLDSGDLKHTVDYRSVYSTLLSKWMNADAEKILRQKFEPMAFL